MEEKHTMGGEAEGPNFEETTRTQAHRLDELNTLL